MPSPRTLLDHSPSIDLTHYSRPEGPTVTTKSDFTEEEWTRVVRAPLVAGLAISLADPGGPIEMAKESMASLKNATNPPSREQLLAEVALEIQGMAQRRENPLKGYKPRPTPSAPTPGDAVLEELTAVQALVAGTSTPDETTAFATWLLAASQAAADAAKDGGFMGFHAQQVSDREQAMIDRVKQAVGA